MDVRKFSNKIGQKFHSQDAPTIVAKPHPSKSPVLVSYVNSSVPMPDRTLPSPREPAFVVHVVHQPVSKVETWISGKHAKLSPISTGGILLYDQERSNEALVREPFEFTRFFITRATLRDLAYHQGLPGLDGLRAPAMGHVDKVIHQLSLALRERQALFGEETDSLFADWVALAFHAHVITAYGSERLPRRPRGGLAPHSLRYICDWITDRLGESLSIAEIAAELDLAPAYFARAFRESTGEPPHRWAMRRRIEHAKSLLSSSQLPIAAIATELGFVDQSHFTRVFSRCESLTPAQWRKKKTL